jgi:hypothetical protein
LKIAGKWKEYSARTDNYQKARKVRQRAILAFLEIRGSATSPLMRFGPTS